MYLELEEAGSQCILEEIVSVVGHSVCYSLVHLTATEENGLLMNKIHVNGSQTSFKLPQ